MRFIAGFLLVIVCSGCARRDGMNLVCEWPPDQAFPIDLENNDHAEHLRDDIQIAEELEIRYGDEVGGARPVSVLGVMVRRGSGASRRPPTARDECRNTLFAIIARTHGLNLDEVLVARGRLGHRGADLAVNIPNAIIYAFLATRVIRRVRQRFEPNERWLFRISIVLVSVVVSVLFLLVGQLLAGVVEIVRVGNEHLSYRAARISWSQHPLEVFVLGVGAFWTLTLAPWTRTQPPTSD
jgi:hypothetical protein